MDRREECRQGKGWKGCVVDKWQKRERKRENKTGQGQKKKIQQYSRPRSVRKDPCEIN